MVSDVYCLEEDRFGWDPLIYSDVLLCREGQIRVGPVGLQ